MLQQCINAVDYCHERNVAHRDLKLDNTLLTHHNPPQIKICDFGFAKLMGGSNLNTSIGTPVYMAPQLIDRNNKGYNGRASGAILVVCSWCFLEV
jgi:serine/threonine-protein kinase SRK2